MRIPVLRSLVLVAVALTFAGAIGPASARRPLDLATLPVEYGYGPVLDGRGSWVETSAGGEWRVTGGDLADEAFAHGLFLATGPATITGTLAGVASDSSGYPNGAIAWQDDSPVASAVILPTDAPQSGVA